MPVHLRQVLTSVLLLERMPAPSEWFLGYIERWCRLFQTTVFFYFSIIATPFLVGKVPHQQARLLDT